MMTSYLQWQSDLSLEQVFAKAGTYSYPDFLSGSLVYLTSIDEQKGRNALMMVNSDGISKPICLTPEPYDLRTQINEYGGKPFWIYADDVYFANKSDQRIYQQNFTLGQISEPRAVSPIPPKKQPFMYADLVKTDSWLLAVVEKVSDKKDQQNSHIIVAFDPNFDDGELIELTAGSDFYSNLCVSPQMNKIAWVQWNHPNMPWNETQLWVADLKFNKKQIWLENKKRINLNQGASVCQLFMASNQRLFFSVDYLNKDIDSADHSADNYWNLKCYDFSQQAVIGVSKEFSEFGYPHWQYGDARIAQLSEDTLLAFAGHAEGDDLYLIDQQTLQIDKVSLPEPQGKRFRSLSGSLNSDQDKVVAIMLSQKANPTLIEFKVNSDIECEVNKVLSAPMVIAEGDISIAEHFSYQTKDNSQAHGYYYPPNNTKYNCNDLPPLLVLVHGGPTARADAFFDLQKQFWTNRGFAIFDVNHRGSTGHGRSYRDSLQGQWGVIEIADIIDGIEYLVQTGQANEEQICIRGKSAGGYTVLRALTEFPNVFKAGACYYGIGNLATLADVTHKFEKYYTDQLIGEEYDANKAVSPESLFFQRSPINKVADLQTAMIIFQGLKDKVVPPKVAQEMVLALEQSGVAHSYVEYPEEGHGFRQAETNIDAWSQELEFYRNVLML